DKTVQSCPSDISHRFASSRWRVAVGGAVSSAWRLRAVRFFEDSLCSVAIEAVPQNWPQRPRLARGKPFSEPPEPRHLDELFGAGAGKTAGAAWENGTVTQPVRPYWSSGGPCPESLNASVAVTGLEAPLCAVGFTWGSDTAIGSQRQAFGSTGKLEDAPKRVHCVEVEQSEVAGEYATVLSLQWYDDQRSEFRTLLRRQVSSGGLSRMAYQPVLAAECGAVVGR
ncbi:unnamed protein product, partial [Polarella glacialis]